MERYEEANNTAGKNFRKKMLADFFLLIFSFFAVFILKRKNFNIDQEYLKLLGIIMISWLVTGFFTNKLKELPNERRYYKKLEPLLTNALLFMGLVTLFIYGFNWVTFSRSIIFGFFGLYIFLEILLLSGNYFPFFRRGETHGSRFSYSLFAFDVLIVVSGFIFLNYIKSGTVIISASYQPILFLLLFLWFFSGLLIHRFKLNSAKNYLNLIYPYLKSAFTVISLVSVIVFIFRTGFSRIMVFGSIIAFSLLEIIFVTCYFIYRRFRGMDHAEVNFFNIPIVSQGGVVEEAVEKEKETSEKVSFGNGDFTSDFFEKKLETIYLKELPDVLNLIKRSVDLSGVDILKAEFFNNDFNLNIKKYPGESLQVFVNISPMNTFGMVNKYLASVNDKLCQSGVFVGAFEPCERRKIYYIRKYPDLLANILYFFDFIWRRIFPKTPVLKQIYFAITRGRSRVFSFAEALGRLYYSGFEIISMENIDSYVYFTGRKIREPQRRDNPSYGIIFKQRRVGKEGKPVYTYKMRTMHPYSEFIHKYIYDLNKLDAKGKIRDDFRITSWGKFMRKFWLDELPMLINLIRRDLRLVGVRPISETMFNTYPEDLKIERVKVKPGLLPPYYADMPGSIEEVFESERKYLQSYFAKPGRTQVTYFFKAMKNILIKRAKSG